MATARDRVATGTVYAVTTQLVWGLQPLFWPLLDSMDSLAIVAHRVVWSCLVAVAFVLVRAGTRADMATLVRSPTALRSLAVSGVLLGASWAAYVYAVVSGHVVEASLALLIGPLLGAVTGVLVFRERMRRAQWFACASATFALAVLIAAYGGVPWLALSIAGTVAAYNLVRKRRPLPAAAGTAIELTMVCPLGLAVILWGGGGSAAAVARWEMVWLLPAAGLITAVPSILRTAAIGRIPLSAYSLVSYLNPALQFAIGVGVRHEPMTASRWAGFALLWCALAVFATDAVRSHRGREAIDRPECPRSTGTAAVAGGAEPRAEQDRMTRPDSLHDVAKPPDALRGHADRDS
ncbi:EamA family transporter RarD [Yinghuangia sp. YIM S10712]|uniref:EamA family transporter RarD n=1 Tax=Yinghuangia sp. YIM S10712 TaxID=3436930 RepID=UPI003F529FC6